MPSADTAVEAPPGPAPAAEYPSSAFVERLLELPVVTKTLNTVSNAYTTYARDSTSGIVKSAVSMADTTATTLVSVALPYLDAHKDTLAKVDSVACRGFDVVEERVERTAEYVANIQRRKDDVVNTVVNTYADPKGQLATVVSSVSDNVAAMKTTTTQKVSSTNGTTPVNFDTLSPALYPVFGSPNPPLPLARTPMRASRWSGTAGFAA